MLPSDVCRCHDGGCPERHNCQRSTERENGRVHCGSLFPYDQPLLSACPCRIALDTVSNEGHEGPLSPANRPNDAFS